MIRAIKIGHILTAAALLTAGAPGWAQSRGGGSRGMTPGQTRASRMAITTAAPLSTNFASFTAVPGLGFDYVHLAAIRGAMLPHRLTGRPIAILAPIFFDSLSPYYFGGSGFIYPQQQPSVIVVQQPPQTIVLAPPDPAGEGSLREAAAPPLPEQASLAEQTPLPELSQFVLVRRDGQVQFAVAFVITGDRLTYITQEGLRRSFAVGELDKDATRQMNDANGTTLVLPD